MKKRKNNFKVCDLAFEHFAGGGVKRLWRVLYWREWSRGRLRCSDYFDNENDAFEFAAAQTTLGDEVIRVDEYELMNTK